jgi:hypothetical protein
MGTALFVVVDFGLRHNLHAAIKTIGRYTDVGSTDNAGFFSLSCERRIPRREGVLRLF